MLFRRFRLLVSRVLALENLIDTEGFRFIEDKGDLPTPISGVITLEDNYTYFITTAIDLLGDRLVGGENTAIVGGSSETSSITSTGLGTGVALLTSAYTMPIRHITLHDVDTALDIDGTGNDAAYDWGGVNFADIPNIGVVKNVDNFIYTRGALLDAGDLVFDGTIGTIAFETDLLVPLTGTTGISIVSSCTITRRFRMTYSAMVVVSGATGINVSPSATISDENYILDTVNFSGAGTYLAGVDETSNTSLFSHCVGITNTAVSGRLSMRSNAVATTVSATDTFYKLAGTTSASADNSKFLHANNRLTCDAGVSRTYLIQATLSFSSGNNHVCEFGFYDSIGAAMRTSSITASTANSGGKAESIPIMDTFIMSAGDYIEVHGANTTGATDITATDLNFIITEIGS